MRLTKISLARNRARRYAGIAAQAAPPSTPARSTAGTAQPPMAGPQYRPTPAPAIAPIVSCPSEPMFHTLARYPGASPSAHSISGVALSSSSPTPYSELIGSMKKTRKAANGLMPMALSATNPVRSIAPIAIGEDAARMGADGLTRRSSRQGQSMRSASSMVSRRGRHASREGTGHPQPDGLGRQFGRRNGVGQTARGQHRQPVADR